MSADFQYHHEAETLFRSTTIAHGLVRHRSPPTAITLSPSRRWAACIIAMSAERREIGKAARYYLFPTKLSSIHF